MLQTKKSIWVFLSAILIIFFLTGCDTGSTGSSDDSTTTDQNSTTPDELLITANYLTSNLIKKENNSLASVKTDLFLPVSHDSGTSINWSILPTSFNPNNNNLNTSNNLVDDIISAIGGSGTVQRPGYLTGDIELELVANITYKNKALAKKFIITVIRLPQTDTELVNEVRATLLDLGFLKLILGDNTAFNYITSDLNFSLASLFGASITWDSNQKNIISDTGIVNPPPYLSGNQTVTVTATISFGNYSLPVDLLFTVIKIPATVEEALEEAKGNILNDIFPPDEDATGITGNLNLPTSGINDTTITWTSDNDLVDSEGNVTRPAFGEGDQTVTLTGTIEKDGVIITIIIVVTVKEIPANDQQAVETDKEKLTLNIILAPGDSQTSVEQDLNLPTEGANYTQIEWTSNKPNIISASGHVNRPTYAEGDQEVTLTAVIKRGSDPEESVTITFTVTVTAMPPTDAEAVNLAKEKVTIENILGDNTTVNAITENLFLPQSGTNGTTIDWVSSKPDVISETGTVSRPSYTDGDQVVVLTGTIIKGTEEVIVEYTVTVPALPATDAEAVEMDKNAIDEDLILGDNPSIAQITIDLNLPQNGTNGATIVWSSNKQNVIQNTGTVNRPTNTEGNSTVTLTATIFRGDVRETISFVVTVIALPPNDAEAVYLDKLALTLDSILGNNTSPAGITYDLDLPQGGLNDTIITWESSNNDFISTTGNVSRPSFTMGNRPITITATIKRGLINDQVSYVVTVLAFPQSDDEAVTEDIRSLTLDLILGDNNLASNVESDLYFPQTGSNGTSINWITSIPEIITATGNLNRPAYTDFIQNPTIQITATVSKGSYSSQVVYQVTVVRLTITEIESVRLDKAKITLERILGSQNTTDNVQSDLIFDQTGNNGTQIMWYSDKENIISPAGTVRRPSYSAGDQAVLIRATIAKSGYSETTEYTVTVTKKIPDDQEAVSLAKAALSYSDILTGNDTASDVQNDLYLTQNGLWDTLVSWSVAPDNSFVDITGSVTRPAYLEGDQTIIVTATISRDAAEVVSDFTLTITKLATTDFEAVQIAWHQLVFDKSVLQQNHDLNSITSALALPLNGKEATTISWESSASEFVSNTGAVIRPEFGEGNAFVTLTATINKYDESKDKHFELIVIQKVQTDQEAVQAAADALVMSVILNGQQPDHIEKKLNLPKSGVNRTNIRWTSSNRNVIHTSGKIIRPDYSEGDQLVTLTATFSKNEFTITKTFELIVIKMPLSDRDAVKAAKAGLTFDIIKKENHDVDSIITDLMLPKTGLNNTNIEWRSNKTETITKAGKVTRESDDGSDITVNLKATIKKGKSTAVKTFTLIVLKLKYTNIYLVKLENGNGYWGTDINACSELINGKFEGMQAKPFISTSDIDIKERVPDRLKQGVSVKSKWDVVISDDWNSLWDGNINKSLFRAGVGRRFHSNHGRNWDYGPTAQSHNQNWWHGFKGRHSKIDWFNKSKWWWMWPAQNLMWWSHSKSDGTLAESSCSDQNLSLIHI